MPPARHRPPGMRYGRGASSILDPFWAEGNRVVTSALAGPYSTAQDGLVPLGPMLSLTPPSGASLKRTPPSPWGLVVRQHRPVANFASKGKPRIHIGPQAGPVRFEFYAAGESFNAVEIFSASLMTIVYASGQSDRRFLLALRSANFQCDRESLPPGDMTISHNLRFSAGSVASRPIPR